MSHPLVQVNPRVAIGGDRLALLAGPCLVEDRAATLDMALRLQDICARLDVPLVFKASYDKANRSSVHGARGFGMAGGLEVLAAVKEATGLPIVTDVHDVAQVTPAAEVADIIQIPAFLCRQTDLLVAAGRSDRVVNVKKGQFMAPADMIHSVEKVRSTGNERVLITERGCSFGYRNLVVDMRAFPIMAACACPLVFDATHSVQLPGAGDGHSSGERQFVAPLARAAIAAGADALFIETHPDPDRAPCDGPNMLPIAAVEALLRSLLAIRAATAAAGEDAP